MSRFSKGFVAPSAVIFLAVMGFVVWYRNHEEALRTSNTGSSTQTDIRVVSENKTLNTR